MGLEKWLRTIWNRGSISGEELEKVHKEKFSGNEFGFGWLLTILRAAGMKNTENGGLEKLGAPKQIQAAKKPSDVGEDHHPTRKKRPTGGQKKG